MIIIIIITYSCFKHVITLLRTPKSHEAVTITHITMRSVFGRCHSPPIPPPKQTVSTRLCLLATVDKIKYRVNSLVPAWDSFAASSMAQSLARGLVSICRSWSVCSRTVRFCRELLSWHCPPRPRYTVPLLCHPTVPVNQSLATFRPSSQSSSEDI